jgi:hypothetical protein
MSYSGFHQCQIHFYTSLVCVVSWRDEIHDLPEKCLLKMRASLTVSALRHCESVGHWTKNGISAMMLDLETLL